MENARKVTVEAASRILKRAEPASVEGVPQKAQLGLELVPDSEIYAQLRKLRGKVKFSKTAEQLKAGR